LPICRAKPIPASHRRPAAGARRHDLDQRQLCDRIEEMQSDQPPGIIEAITQVLKPDAGGVGCQNRASFQLRLDACKEFPLCRQVFKDGFDHHIRPGNALAIGICPEAGRLRPRRRPAA
jgi:hypothetical protein